MTECVVNSVACDAEENEENEEHAEEDEENEENEEDEEDEEDEQDEQDEEDEEEPVDADLRPGQLCFDSDPDLDIRDVLAIIGITFGSPGDELNQLSKLELFLSFCCLEGAIFLIKNIYGGKREMGNGNKEL
jgi:hypothetical protein